MVPEKLYALRIRLGSLDKYPDLGNVADLNGTAQARAYSESKLQIDQTNLSTLDPDELHILRYNLFFLEHIMAIALADQSKYHFRKLQMGVFYNGSVQERLEDAAFVATYLDLLHGSRIAVSHLEMGFPGRSSSSPTTPSKIGTKPQDLFKDGSIGYFVGKFTQPEVVRGELYEREQRVDKTLGNLANRLRTETATGLVLPCQTRSAVVLGVQMARDVLLSMRDRTRIADKYDVRDRLWEMRN